MNNRTRSVVGRCMDPPWFTSFLLIPPASSAVFGVKVLQRSRYFKALNLSSASLSKLLNFDVTCHIKMENGRDFLISSSRGHPVTCIPKPDANGPLLSPNGTNLGALCGGIHRGPVVPQIDTMVVAASPIPLGSVSRPMMTGIALRRLLIQPPIRSVVKIGVTNGILHLEANSKAMVCTWANLLRVAADCQEQNMRVSRTDQGFFILEPTRLISPGEELKVWFSTYLAAELQVPFLSPVNIQGNQAYVCHICRITFTQPNALKVHLMLDCQPSISSQWPPVRNSTEGLDSQCGGTMGLSHTASSSFMEKRIHHFRTLPLLDSKPYPAPVQSIPNLFQECDNQRMHPISPKCEFKTQESHTVLQVAQTCHKPRTDGICAESSAAMPSTSFNKAAKSTHFSTDLCDGPSHFPMANNHVTPLRKSRGHICLLCGKVYSRKYGLKIHLRTHTGHKPLRCKYCARPFSDPSNLNKHVRLHAEADTPYRCPHCSKVLVRRRDLERHIRSRHSSTSEQDNQSTQAE